MAAFLTLVIGVVTFLLVLGYLKIRNTKKFWTKLGVPRINPPGFTDFIWNKKITFAQLDQDLYNTVKPLKYAGYFEVLNPVLFVTDLDLVKSVTIKDFDHFVDRRGFEVEKNDPHMYLTLFNQSGDDWRELRSKMSPTFTTGKIRRMFQIFDNSSKKLVKALRGRIIGKDEVDMREFLTKVTMDIIASAAFGIQTDLFEDPDSYFAKMGYNIQQQFAGKQFFKMLLILFTPWLAEKLNLKITDSEADKFFTKVIKESLNRRINKGEKRDDFLQLMLEARQGVIKQEDESQLDDHEKSAKLHNVGTSKSKIDFSDDLIIAQCLLFILGGFDTVETSLSWAVYSLGLNPEVQERLHQEVKASYEANDEKFSYDTIGAMDYLDRFIQETLRLYPPAVRLERRSVKPWKIPGTNVVVPKDILVSMSLFGLHRDPELWPEPEKFDPDRFLKENVSKRHPCAYAPFGIGPRNCIGNRFALVECKLIIAYLVLNFKFEACKQTVIPPKFNSTGNLKPEGGIWMKVTPRIEVEE